MHKIIEELRSTNSRIEKESILKREHGADNIYLSYIFEMCYSPKINFWIKKIPEYSYIEDDYDAVSALKLIEKEICSRNKTGNEAINYLKYVLEHTNKQEVEIIECVVKRDMKCGVTETTINKIWKGLIPETPCMLATAYSDKTLKNIKFPAYVQNKMDGSRMIATVIDSFVTMQSRNGKPYLGLTNLEEVLSNLPDGVYDGELLYAPQGDVSNRTLGNGVVNKASKGTISYDEQKDMKFVVWDYIQSVNNYNKGLDKTHYNQRFLNLFKIVEDANVSNIEIVETCVVDNLEEARKEFKRQTSLGNEGIILKNIDASWENKRSKHLVKFKEELYADLVITNVVEGDGKYKNMLGALECRTNDGIIQVSIGSGFTDADRQKLWLNKEEILGTIVEVKYNAIVEDKRTGQKSLFLPIFKQIRLDKSIANNFDNMQ